MEFVNLFTVSRRYVSQQPSIDFWEFPSFFLLNETFLFQLFFFDFYFLCFCFLRRKHFWVFVNDLPIVAEIFLLYMSYGECVTISPWRHNTSVSWLYKKWVLIPRHLWKKGREQKKNKQNNIIQYICKKVNILLVVCNFVKRRKKFGKKKKLFTT